MRLLIADDLFHQIEVNAYQDADGAKVVLLSVLKPLILKDAHEYKMPEIHDPEHQSIGEWMFSHGYKAEDLIVRESKFDGEYRYFECQIHPRDEDGIERNWYGAWQPIMVRTYRGDKHFTSSDALIRYLGDLKEKKSDGN